MTSEQFLAVIEQKGLLPPELLAKLRATVAKSGKEISARQIAKSLIDKGHLTAFQAQQLSGESEPKKAAPTATKTAAKPAKRPAPQPLDDSDQLVPLDESSELTPLDEGSELTPLDESSELTPLDESSELTPLDEGSELTPLEDSAELTPLEDELALTPLDDGPKSSKPAKPAPKAAPAKPAPQKPAAKPAAKSGGRAPAPAAREPSVSLLEDELGLGSSGSPLDDLLAGGDEPLAATGNPLMPATAKKKGLFQSSEPATPAAKKKKSDQPKVKKSEWDSPLMLVGGGALILMLLVGGVLLYLNYVGASDNQFDLAEKDYKDSSYTQAIGKFDAFIEANPSHQNVSAARVHRALSKLKLAMQTSTDMSRAIVVANEVLVKIEEEKEFDDVVRRELASLLPDIAEGSANAAQKEKDLTAKKTKLADTEKALELVNNQNFVPKRYRSVERMARIQGIMNLVERELNRGAELDKTVESMNTEAQAGHIGKAYEVRKSLLKTYPELTDNKQLVDALANVSKLEQTAVKVSGEATPAATKENPTKIIAALTPANRVGGEAADGDGRSVVLQAAGAVYGLAGASGNVLWRRSVGFDPRTVPVQVSSDPESDVLVSDLARGELLRLNSKTGKLVWRQTIGEPFMTPLVAQGHAIVATRAGRVISFDLSSGESNATATVPQELRQPAVASGNGKFIYQIGEHSSLYVLGAGQMDCKEVFYLGHEPASVVVPPVVAARHLIVAENNGAETSELRVLSTDAEGVGLKPAQRVEVTGHILTSPVTLGRMLLVFTDRGQILIYALGFANDEKPLTPVADSPATGLADRIPMAIGDDSNLWIARSELAKFEVQAVGGRMLAQSLAETFEGDTFDDRLLKAGKLLVTVRHRPQTPGVIVTAIDQAGKRVWETLLGAPPASEPVVNMERKEINLVTATGALFTFDPAAIKARVRNQAVLAAGSDKQRVMLKTGTALADGMAVFTAGGGDKQVLMLRPREKDALSWVALPDPLACAPTRFGKGFVAPTQGGQLIWVSAANGQQLSTPFQPNLQAGSAPKWQPVGTASDDATDFVASDGQAAMYRVGLKAEPTSFLAAVGENTNLAAAVVSPVAVLDKIVAAVDSEQHLLVFTLPAIKPEPNIALEGQCVFGPERVGERILVANDQNELLCVDKEGKLAWRAKLAHGSLSGKPLAVGADIVVASKSGAVWKIAGDSGEQSAPVEIGQPLGTGPVAFGERLVVAGHDGTVFVIDRP